MKYNTIIIGAGPAGMAAALYLARSGLSVLLIDKDAPGGQMLKTSNIENYLGIESINGADLAMQMQSHLKKYDVKWAFGEVTKIQKKDKYLVMTNNNEYIADNIIIATGRKPNKLGLANEDKIHGISYCAVCDGTFYKDKNVGVVGGGNAAFTNALYLANLCKKIYIIVRHKVKADKALVAKANQNKNIVILEKTEIKKLTYDNSQLNSVILNNDEVLNIQGLFIAIGGKPKVDFINVDMENGYIKVNEKMETSLPNVYACGDVIKKNYYQIATAINDGVIAALAIKSRWDK